MGGLLGQGFLHDELSDPQPFCRYDIVSSDHGDYLKVGQ